MTAGDLNLPYEDSPTGPGLLNDGHIAGGVVIMAAVVPVAGGARMPCLVYRFAKPDGSGFYPAMVLALPDDELAALGTLTLDAIAAALRAVKQQRAS